MDEPAAADDDRDVAVTVERPDVSEVDALVDLWAALAVDQRTHDSHLLPDANRPAIRDALARHAVTGGVQVARHDGEIVGFVTFGTEAGAYEQDVSRGVVRNVFVRPAYRGQGIGSRLMDVAESALESVGATVVSLEAMAANDRARAFYRARGYEPHRVQFEKRLEETAGERDGDAPGPDSDPSPGSAAGENDTHSKED